jgi:hypothetical protein
VSERVETKKKGDVSSELVLWEKQDDSCIRLQKHCCRKNKQDVSETVAGKTRERERERERGVHACHEENKIGSWILMSKDGMRTEVIVLDRCGKVPKVLFSDLSR